MSVCLMTHPFQTHLNDNSSESLTETDLKAEPQAKQLRKIGTHGIGKGFLRPNGYRERVEVSVQSLTRYITS